MCTQTMVCGIKDRLSYTKNFIKFFCITQYKSYLLSLLKNLSHNISWLVVATICLILIFVITMLET